MNSRKKVYAIVAALLLVSPRITFADGRDLPAVRGEMPLEYYDGYLFASTASGPMLVDFCNGQSVIARSIAHGSGEMVTMPEFVIGGLTFASASFRVSEALPKCAGRSIVGVLGMDLLRRADVITLRFKGGNGKPSLVMKGKNGLMKGTVDIPFTMKNDVPFLKGELNGKPLEFLLDTCSPESYLSLEALRSSGLAARPGSVHKVTGPDGLEKKVSSTMPATLRLGSRELSSVAFSIGILPSFTKFTENQNPALIGNDVLEKLGMVELDFTTNVLRIPS